MIASCAIRQIQASGPIRAATVQYRQHFSRDFVPARHGPWLMAANAGGHIHDISCVLTADGDAVAVESEVAFFVKRVEW